MNNNDNLIYLQCKKNINGFLKGTVYRVVNKFDEFWLLQLGDTLIKLYVKDIRDYFIPVVYYE